MRWIFAPLLMLGLGRAAAGQVPANAPAGATGICRDGTYTTQPAKDGACQGHKGVQTWYATAPLPAAATPAPQAPATAAASKPGPAAAAAAKAAAPGGGPTLVWLNTSSNVYHCFGDPYYGKTKAGAYMSEADARSKGAHGPRGATCSAK